MVNIHITSLLLAFSLSAVALPQYGSLAEFQKRVNMVKRTPTRRQNAPDVTILPTPTPLTDSSSKLVNDAAHSFQAPGPNDMRGPCPGLNTLANHGYIDRSGVDSPQNIIKAAQDGFNMGFDLAFFATYLAFVGDGNHVTNLVSIGAKSNLTGEDTGAPATIAGFNTHLIFEGDASLTRSDDAIGDNFHLNQTLFDQFDATARQFNETHLTLEAVQEVRFARIEDSKARNPTFDLSSPRFTTIFAESNFPLAFFTNGTNLTDLATIQAPLTDVRTFFVDQKFPDNFYKREGFYGLELVSLGAQAIFAPHPQVPGSNNGTGNFVPSTTDTGDMCFLYPKQLARVQALYPNPTGLLLQNLKQNLRFFYTSLSTPSCVEQFPYGQ